MKDNDSLLDQLTIDRSGDDGSNPYKIGVVILSILLLIALSLLIYLWLFSSTVIRSTENSNKNNKTKSVVQSSIVTSEPEKINDRSNIALSAAGYVVARRIATISSEITGRITEVLVEEGLAVESGQLLARLDDAQIQVNLKRALANVTSVKTRIDAVNVNLSEAKRILKRQQDLRKQGYSNEANLTNAMTQVEGLEVELSTAKIALELSEIEVLQQREFLNDTFINAPFSGIVVNKAAQAGEVISPISGGGGFTRTGICTLVDMNSLEIEVDVNEAYIGRVSSGQKVRALLDAYPDWELDASVIAIVPTANRSKATVRVRIAIDDLSAHNTDNNFKILPEMGVKVDFIN